MYRIKFMKPYYYLQQKGKFLWVFTWWNTLEFSQDYDYIEHLYKLKTNPIDKTWTGSSGFTVINDTGNGNFDIVVNE